jgi:hypothetical protein
VADALATAFFVGGPEVADRYCAAHPGTLAMLALAGEDAPRVFGGSSSAMVVFRNRSQVCTESVDAHGSQGATSAAYPCGT